MLTELTLSQYPVVQPLFEPLDFNLVIRSVIAGNTPAWVYADDATSPRLAVIWDLQDAVLFAGDPAESAATDDLRAMVFDRILPNARQRGIPELALFYTPQLESTLPVLLPGLDLKPAGRYSFRLEHPRCDPPGFGALPALPAGFTLRRVDDALLSSHLTNLPGLR